MHISEIDTPALVVDLDIFERNLARVADYAREHRLRLRPHTKTHKSVRLAKRQIASGAAGLTVAKVSEAEVMATAEPDDLLIAYPIIGHTKLARLTLDGVRGKDERGRILVVHRFFDLRDRLRPILAEVAENPDEAGAKLGSAPLEMYPIDDFQLVVAHLVPRGHLGSG